MKVFLCEKPSQARDIAKVLGPTKQGDGCLMGDSFAVTWGFGHLLELAAPEDYDDAWKRWTLQALPMLPDTWQTKPTKQGSKQLRAVKSVLKKATSVVIATDADREGEVIAREILEHAHYKGGVERLWLSALDEASIRKALGEIKPGSATEPLYQAGLARCRADWLVGMNLTRAYTVAGRERGYDGVLSVGRVQTPTLAIVVARDKGIEGFQPVPYYMVVAECSAKGSQFSARWIPKKNVCDDEGRCLRKEVADAARDRISKASARVTSAERKEVSQAPPLPLSLSALQQLASRRFGLGAQEVLDTAQALYETHKIATYPRSDCRYLPDSQRAEAGEILRALGHSDEGLRELVDAADVTLRSKAWNDKKVTAHHAIIPTSVAPSLKLLNANELQVYDLVRRHYIAQFLPPHRYEQTRLELEADGETLRTSGRVELAPGWQIALGKQEDEDSKLHKDDDTDSSGALPNLKQGDAASIADAKCAQKSTKPPRPYTEGTLIAAMQSVGKEIEDTQLRKVLKETSGIGTEATRANILETLVARGYVQRLKKGKTTTLQSTEKGRTLIEVLPDAIINPALTAVWEQRLDEIALGKRSLSGFLAKQNQFVSLLVGRIQKQLNEGVSTGLTGLVVNQPKCPECQSPMRSRKGKHGPFWGCSRYPDCKGIMQDGGGAKKRQSPRRKKTTMRLKANTPPRGKK